LSSMKSPLAIFSKRGIWPREFGRRKVLRQLPFAKRLYRNQRKLVDVMLSEAKHLVFSSCYKVEILRLRLRMTIRHSLKEG
jgi:hypothetical protein